jgi:hypothetical protein
MLERKQSRHGRFLVMETAAVAVSALRGALAAALAADRPPERERGGEAEARPSLDPFFMPPPPPSRAGSLAAGEAGGEALPRRDGSLGLAGLRPGGAAGGAAAAAVAVDAVAAAAAAQLHSDTAAMLRERMEWRERMARERRRQQHQQLHAGGGEGGHPTVTIQIQHPHDGPGFDYHVEAVFGEGAASGDGSVSAGEDEGQVLGGAGAGAAVEDDPSLAAPGTPSHALSPRDTDTSASDDWSSLRADSHSMDEP